MKYLSFAFVAAGLAMTASAASVYAQNAMQSLSSSGIVLALAGVCVALVCK